MRVFLCCLMCLVPTACTASIDVYEVTPANIHEQHLPLRVDIKNGVEYFESLQFRVVAAIGPGAAVDSLGGWGGTLVIPNKASAPIFGYQEGDSLAWTFSIGRPVPVGAEFAVEWSANGMPAVRIWRLHLDAFAKDRGYGLGGRGSVVLVAVAGFIGGCALTLLIRLRRIARLPALQ